MKRALLTGVTGQDGSVLAELLLSKGYEVHALRRRTSTFSTGRIAHLLSEWHDANRLPLHLHYGDLTDALSLFRILRDVQPDEVFHLAAQSHVGVSFFEPEHTGDVDALGTTRLLDAIRTLGISPRFYNAASSEMFGKVHEIPQTERTPFHPRSPYGVAKCYSYYMTVMHREAYGMFACNGILFNHEGISRGETFVTRKITRAMTRMLLGLQDCLYLGNLDARRDWGHARDFVEAQWLMLQQPEPDDYVIATGEQHSVREFVEEAATCLDWTVRWEGSGDSEVGVVGNRTIVRIDPQYKRPAEVDTLLGDSSKARKVLNWKPRHTFSDLVSEMVEHDMRLAVKEQRT